MANIETEINNYTDYEDDLISYLNKNPLISYTVFKKKAIDIYLKHEYEFTIKKTTLSNISY